MHDITNFEIAGLPSVMVASSEFREAVSVQAAALGFEPSVVYVPHPIQDRTDDELRAIADDAVDQLITQLTADGRAPHRPASAFPRSTAS